MSGQSDETITAKGLEEIKRLYSEPARLTQLPSPFLPPEIDLRTMAYMPLDVARLRDSRMANHPNPEVFRSAVLLWCASWHQVPAGSLPNDDIELARFAGFGRDHQGWLVIREEVLRGFVECSDARLYHKVVCEKASIAWEKKWDRPEKADERKEHARTAANARWKKKKRRTARAMPEQCPSNAQSCLKGSEGKGIEENKKEPSLREGKRASRIPEDWKLSEEDRAFALTLLQPHQVPIEEAKFRDYWTAKAGPKAVKKDWPATWRTWVRNALDFNRNGGVQNERPDKSASAAAGRIFDLVGGSDAASSYVPGTSGPRPSGLDRQQGKDDPKRLPKG